MPNSVLDIKTLENWLWEAACSIRGEIDAPKYKDYILPLIFIKRLSDVFDDELNTLSEKFGSPEKAEKLIEIDHSLVRFYLPKKARWENISKQTTGLGEYLTDVVRAISRENPKLQGVIDIVDFNATTAGQRVISDESLKRLIEILGRYRLGLKDVEPDIFGRAYEYLLRKFAEGSGQSAGEFYTPKEVAILMSYLLDPEPGHEVYDPCCGSGGLLIKTFLRFRDKYGHDTTLAPLKFYGQEILASTFAMARMNAFIHDMEADIAIGNTMERPAFLNSDGSLKSLTLSLPIPCGIRNLSSQPMKMTPIIDSSSATHPKALLIGAGYNTCIQASRTVVAWLWLLTQERFLGVVEQVAKTVKEIFAKPLLTTTSLKQSFYFLKTSFTTPLHQV